MRARYGAMYTSPRPIGAQPERPVRTLAVRLATIAGVGLLFGPKTLLDSVQLVIHKGDWTAPALAAVGIGAFIGLSFAEFALTPREPQS